MKHYVRSQKGRFIISDEGKGFCMRFVKLISISKIIVIVRCHLDYFYNFHFYPQVSWCEEVGVKNDGLREVNHSISGRIIKGHIDVKLHLRHLHRKRWKIIFKILINLIFDEYM